MVIWGQPDTLCLSSFTANCLGSPAAIPMSATVAQPTWAMLKEPPNLTAVFWIGMASPVAIPPLEEGGDGDEAPT